MQRLTIGRAAVVLCCTLAATTETLAFSMSGLSKIAGLPQMKLGWIVIGGPPVLLQQVPKRLFRSTAAIAGRSS